MKGLYVAEVPRHVLTGHHQDQPAPPTLRRRVCGCANNLTDRLIEFLLRLTRRSALHLGDNADPLSPIEGDDIAVAIDAGKVLLPVPGPPAAVYGNAKVA
ncbi:MAG TPA: hypothetical protein VFD85_12820 [Gemmatimonadales bacterium]|nr:hypothetical protein [Gemmatimonadales bacterium]